MIIFLLLFNFIFSIESLLDNIKEGDEDYRILLNTGDVLICYIDFINPEEKKISLSTNIGKTTLSYSDIKEIDLYKNYYKASNRSFILPTAEAIGDNYYVGNLALGMFYGGFGASQYFSAVAGSTIIPGVIDGGSVWFLNIKSTVLDIDWVNQKGGMSLALSHNYAEVGKNVIKHFAITTTFRNEKSNITGSFFYKYGNDDFYNIKVFDDLYNYKFANGNIGLHLALDRKLSNFENTHFLLELINGNIGEPSITGILAGVRVFNGSFSADFGLLLFTKPFITPVINFVWTPFK